MDTVTLFKHYYRKSVAQLPIDTTLQNKLASHLFTSKPDRPARGWAAITYYLTRPFIMPKSLSYVSASVLGVVALGLVGTALFPQHYVSAKEAIDRSIAVVNNVVFNSAIHQVDDAELEQLKNDPNINEVNYERTENGEMLSVSSDTVCADDATPEECDPLSGYIDFPPVDDTNAEQSTVTFEISDQVEDVGTRAMYCGSDYCESNGITVERLPEGAELPIVSDEEVGQAINEKELQAE